MRGVYSPIGHDSKLVHAGAQMRHFPAAPTCEVMAVFSGTRVVWVLCELVVAHCCVAACFATGLRPTVLGDGWRPFVVTLLNALCF